MTLFGNIRTMAHVDTEDLEKLTELAHTPVQDSILWQRGKPMSFAPGGIVGKAQPSAE